MLGNTNLKIIPEDNFVRASVIDYKGYEKVCFCEDIVMAFINGKMTVDQLLVHEDVINSPTFQNSLIIATLLQMHIGNIIL